MTRGIVHITTMGRAFPRAGKESLNGGQPLLTPPGERLGMTSDLPSDDEANAFNERGPLLSTPAYPDRMA